VINAVEGISLNGLDRVQQRITEIESKFGMGGDFQRVLTREMEKINPATQVEGTKAVQKTQKAKNTPAPEEATIKINEPKQSTENPQTTENAEGKNYLPGEEALPQSINGTIKPVMPEAEEIEVPEKDTKREPLSSTEEIIELAAEKYNVDANLVKAVAIAESNMNQDDISDAGAIGVMQLMPETAASLGVNPYDEQENIEGGAKYLREMLDTFNGNVRQAVAAYNAGPNAVKKYGGIPPYSETQHYVGRVMDLYQ